MVDAILPQGSLHQTIMIVEDNPGHRELLKKTLERENYKVIEAERGDAAIQMLDSVKPNLIMMDIMMPGMDGWETSRRIKESEATKDIPVVMFSVVSFQSAKEKSVNFAHAEYHLTKPAKRSEILEVVGKYVKG